MEGLQCAGTLGEDTEPLTVCGITQNLARRSRAPTARDSEMSCLPCDLFAESDETARDTSDGLFSRLTHGVEVCVDAAGKVEDHIDRRHDVGPQFAVCHDRSRLPSALVPQLDCERWAGVVANCAIHVGISDRTTHHER